MSKIFISTPCYDAMMTMQYTISILKLTQFLTTQGIPFVIDFIGNESLIPRARNSSLAKFMKSNFSHLLFIDSDIEFSVDAVIDLITFDKDVVCCCYPKKSYNWKRLMYSLQNENQSKEHIHSRGLDFTHNVMKNKDGNLIEFGDFVRVKEASTGFMMIKREILQKLIEKHTELEIVTDSLSQKDEKICGLFCTMIKNNRFLSEDYSFCQRVNDIGGQIWVSRTQNINHIGKHVFSSDIKNRTFIGRNSSERNLYE